MAASQSENFGVFGRYPLNINRTKKETLYIRSSACDTFLAVDTDIIRILVTSVEEYYVLMTTRIDQHKSC